MVQQEYEVDVEETYEPEKVCYFLTYFFLYKPINDTSFELSVFWLSDTENRINELRFSGSISLSFKTRLTSVSCFCGDAISNFQPWNQRRKT